jgi:hypothetical protein
MRGTRQVQPPNLLGRRRLPRARRPRVRRVAPGRHRAVRVAGVEPDRVRCAACALTARSGAAVKASPFPAVSPCRGLEQPCDRQAVALSAQPAGGCRARSQIRERHSRAADRVRPQRTPAALPRHVSPGCAPGSPPFWPAAAAAASAPGVHVPQTEQAGAGAHRHAGCLDLVRTPFRPGRTSRSRRPGRQSSHPPDALRPVALLPPSCRLRLAPAQT